MPKRGKASKAPDGETVVAGHSPVAEPPPVQKEETRNAPSGKHYVIAQESYPCEVPGELASEVVTANDGDLLELLLVHEDWAYGQRFRSRADAVNEGVFRLEWVLGVKTVTHKDGVRRPVEVDISSAEYGFQPPRAGDTAARLRAKRHRKKLEDAAKLWSGLEGPPGSLSGREAEAAEKAAAAKAAAALERDEASEKTRRQKRHRQARRPVTQAAAEEGGEREAGRTATAASAAAERQKIAWDAQWEQQAALLEQQMSSSSGVEDCDGGQCHRRSLQKKVMTRKFTKSLLMAKRSGELEAIAEEWERAHTELASKTSDIEALNEQVKQSMLSATQAGDLECIADDMVVQVEKHAAEMKALKERAFRAMFEMKRSRERERDAERAAGAQGELETGAHQLRSLMRRAWRGLLESKKSRELERIADEMAEQLQTRADPIKSKIRKALLRAHRAGQLLELRGELDELADSVPVQMRPPSGAPPNKRWVDIASSDSDSWCDPQDMARRRREDTGAGGGPRSGLAQPLRAPPLGGGSGAHPGEADVSGSENSGERSLSGSPDKHDAAE